MVTEPAKKKLAAAYFLSLLSGIIGLSGSIIMTLYSMPFIEMLLGLGGIFIMGFYFDIWMIVSSGLTIVFGWKLKANPEKHSKWGVSLLFSQ